jgi:hypothetical protein
MAEQVRAEVDLGDEDILQRLLEDERLTELFERAIGEGVRSSYEAKRLLLARALAHGFEDGVDLDDSFILVKVIAELEPPHVKVLDRLVEASLAGERVHPEAIIAEAYPSGSQVAAPIVSTLVQLGLLVGRNTWAGATMNVVTPFGYRLIGLLRGEVIEPPPEPDTSADDAAFGPERSATADVTVRVDRYLNPYDQSETEVFVILNRGPALATNVSISIEGGAEPPFIGDVFPVTELEANDDYQVQAHWAMGDPSPPYNVVISWTDGSGQRSKPFKLMPRVVSS